MDLLRLRGGSAATSGSKDPVLDTVAKGHHLIRRVISETCTLSYLDIQPSATRLR